MLYATVMVSGSSKEEYDVHVDSHFEHRCSRCAYSSRTEGRLRRHVRDFHGTQPDDVSQTNMTSMTFDHHHHHQQQQQQQKLIKCRQCPFSTRVRVSNVISFTLFICETYGENRRGTSRNVVLLIYLFTKFHLVSGCVSLFVLAISNNCKMFSDSELLNY